METTYKREPVAADGPVPDTPPLHYFDTDRSDPGPRFTVPGEEHERHRLKNIVVSYVESQDLVPPLLMSDLEHHADALLQTADIDRRHREFLFILLNNEVWRSVVAAVPYARRMLMLPPCLRNSGKCRAKFDKLGLLCEHCGACDICALSEKAEDLGYTVLVAEGTSTVTSLVKQGKIDALVGVCCMAALERSFPHMVAGAVPSLAIPLFEDGCRDTMVDTAWVLDAMRLNADGDGSKLIDLSLVHTAVRSWFDVENMRRTLRADDTETENIAIEWLAGPGKRWRPFLSTCVYMALHDCRIESLPESVRNVAIAVECMHKASLIYDDIQDDDARRYGEPTVHIVHGVPLAMTAALFLLGVGYRLLSECGYAAEQQAQMLNLATDGHCRLCLGQGEELCWTRAPGPLSCRQVLQIFRLKTAPSFEVVLGLGAICADADEAIGGILKAYSEALGIAYQIRDDLEDFTDHGDGDDIRARRPSIVLALACEHATAAEREILNSAWLHGVDAVQADAIRTIIVTHSIEKEARDLLSQYEARALSALQPLRNRNLKMILCRVAGKVLGT